MKSYDSLSVKAKIVSILFQLLPNTDVVYKIMITKYFLEMEESRDYHLERLTLTIIYPIIPLHRGIEWSLKSRSQNNEFIHYDYTQFKNYLKMMTCPGFIKNVYTSNLPSKLSSLSTKIGILRYLSYQKLWQCYQEYMYDDGTGIHIVNDKTIRIY